MRRSTRVRRSVPATALVATALAVAAVLPGTALPALAEADAAPDSRGIQLAVLGDTPYGDAQRAEFPSLVDDVNADPAVRLVLHAGDVKSGSSTCDDARFADLAALYDTFADPFVLTPGDNEWTDCHRAAAGSYVPTERLEAVRRTFFPEPGRTLGARPMRVDTQAEDPTHAPYVENVMFTRKQVVFSTLHVVGSENDLLPWSGLADGDRPAERQAEYDARLAADLDWLEQTFARAEAQDAAGVLVMMQAEPLATPGFQPVRDRLFVLAADFGRPVLLVHGDEHVYEAERRYGGIGNLTRLETFGDTAASWLRLSVDPTTDEVFSWTPRAVAPDATLERRAILPSDAYQPGPVSGTAVAPNNGVTPPFPGQPIPGFSAVLDAGGGEFWGMPDNGYGAKGNSADFLLRLYRIRPQWKTADGGSGTVEVLSYLSLRDPDRRIPFPLTRDDRMLTGADFDLESVRRAKDGTFWFGEEFGPFLLHTDASGRVLEAPVPTPGTQSPQNPFLASPDAWNLPASRGFESMAMTPDGRRLYPVNEGALRTDPDPRRRIVHEYDLASRSWTDRTWSYRTDAAFPNAVLGDMTALDQHRFLVIERDDDQGADARQKKVYLVDLRRVDEDGYLEKTLVLDLLSIADPGGVSLPARPGEYGVGEDFSFPLQSVESVEVLGGQRLLIANDNNYPGSDGRWIARDRPDDTELIVVRVPGLR